MIFLSAGHDLKDPGAVANGVKENELTMELRDLTHAALKRNRASVSIDKDDETLAQYLRRIKPGTGSVVCEIHFNAGQETANGIEVLVPDRSTTHERALAAEICMAGVDIIGLRNRGVKDETQSHRGRLGLMREEGMNVLIEVCFITNTLDLARYQENKRKFAAKLAYILQKYDGYLA